jgi:hypothetical protein
MKIQLIETKESDGDWYKVYVNGNVKSCICKNSKIRTEEESLKRAEEIFQFYYENDGKDKVIKEFESIPAE